MNTVLAKVADIPEGGRIVVPGPNGVDIALFKIDGKVFALDNRCPHMEGPLGEGEVKGDVVTCPWHGWDFCIPTGECLNMPGIDATTLAVAVEGDEVILLD